MEQPKIETQVHGLGPLSFDLDIGAELLLKEIQASDKKRPVVGSAFKASGLLVFKKGTKIGNLKLKDLDLDISCFPQTCTVSKVDKVKKKLFVTIQLIN